MSFLTPPPDFEECTRSKVLFNNTACIVEDVFYPSPSSLRSESHSESYSPHTPPSTHYERSFLEHVDAQQQSIFADSTAPLNFEHTNMSHSFGMDTQYNIFEQNTWSAFPSISDHYPLSNTHSGSNFYATYQTPHSTIPADTISTNPTPVSPPTYNFNDATMPSSYPPLSVRQTFSPDRSTSMSTYSRSCSPNPSHISVTNHGLHRRHSSRSSSVTSTSSPLSHYGIPVRAPGSSPNANPQAWRCAYPNCTSRATFIRGCDLRKHYNRHSKHLFCRIDGCPQSETAAVTAAQTADPHCKDPSQLVLSGGFSSKKDRARHEAKHNPGIKCEWQGSDGEGCGRVFSRMDNMKDHVRRIHQKGQHTGDCGDKSRKMKRSR